MKRILTIIALILISYGTMTFIILEWNPFEWENYEIVCMLLILALELLIYTVIESSKTMKPDTTNDEIIESYKENKKRC